MSSRVVLPNKRFNPTCAAGGLFRVVQSRPRGTRGLTWSLGGSGQTYASHHRIVRAAYADSARHVAGLACPTAAERVCLGVACHARHGVCDGSRYDPVHLDAGRVMGCHRIADLGNWVGSRVRRFGCVHCSPATCCRNRLFARRAAGLGSASRITAAVEPAVMRRTRRCTFPAPQSRAGQVSLVVRLRRHSERCAGHVACPSVVSHAVGTETCPESRRSRVPPPVARFLRPPQSVSNSRGSVVSFTPCRVVRAPSRQVTPA